MELQGQVHGLLLSQSSRCLGSLVFDQLVLVRVVDEFGRLGPMLHCADQAAVPSCATVPKLQAKNGSVTRSIWLSMLPRLLPKQVELTAKKLRSFCRMFMCSVPSCAILVVAFLQLAIFVECQ